MKTLLPDLKTGREKCVKKFLKAFPRGFHDETYLSWERDYKWDAHIKWEQLLPRKMMEVLLAQEDYETIAMRAIQIESRTNLLFSFEKMALRDGVKNEGTKLFAQGLYNLLHGEHGPEERFEGWCSTIQSLPKKGTRVFTWPVVTVFGFLAQPKIHSYLKPTVTKIAMEKYGLPFPYESKPNWKTYKKYLDLSKQVRSELKELKPRDFIDIQSFLWVQGSEEY